MKLKKFLKQFSRKTILATAGILVAVGSAIAVTQMTAIASFGPDRPVKPYTDGVAGFDHVTFNSFTGVPNIGDERTFFNGKYTDAGTVYSDPMPEVKDGDELTLMVYVHNGADASLNDKADNPGVATNTKVRVALPSGIAKTQQATAYVSADNASPSVVHDTMDFGAQNGGSFALEYIPGSAHVKGNYIDTRASDSIVTTGALVGTNALDGRVRGCFKEMIYVTIKVKVKMPQYNIEKEVRMKGQTSSDWAENKAAKPGDTVQWLVTFSNTGTTLLQNINIIDKVPVGMTVVPGTVKLINGNYPSGYVYPDTAIQDGGRIINVMIGDYNPGPVGVAYLIYDTKIDQPAADICTTHNLVNQAFSTPQGFGAIWDDASVTVPGNDCTVPTPVYSCDDLVLTPNYSNRTVAATVKYTAKDGATYKNTTLVWGDNKQDVITGTTASHQYAADGTYTVTANMLFTVNGVDKTPANNPACSETVTFTPPTVKQPSIKIEKTVEKAQVEVGKNYTYTIKVTNNGEVDLTAIKVYDKPADGSNIQLVSSNGVGTLYENVWTYTIPSLKVGESKTFTLTAKVTEYKEGSLVNTACVNAPEVNPTKPTEDDGCSSATVVVVKPVVLQPSIKIEKTVEKAQVEVGKNYTYTIKVTNNGEVDLTAIKVYDKPADGSNIQLVSSNGVGTLYENVWTYTIPSLKVGESKTFTLTAKVTEYKEGSLVNTACVNAPEVNPTKPTEDDGCGNATVTVKKPVVPTPVYSCDALTLTVGANRALTAKVDYTAKDGASLKMVTYTWGDSTTPFTTDKTSADHTYSSDGTFSVSVRLLFDVKGVDTYAADNVNCVKTVTYTSPSQSGTTTPTTKQTLPNTGAGSVIGLFSFVSVLSALGYRLLLGRKLAREN